VRQFEAEVASPAASVADFERQVAQQENALSVLVGTQPWRDRAGRALTEMAGLIPVPAGVPSTLLGNRPTSGAPKRRSAPPWPGSASRRPPSFRPSRSRTVRHAEHRVVQMVRVRTNIWQAFAGVSIPLFKDGRPGAGEQVNIARARATQARSRYEQTVLVALREVEDALVGLRTAQDRSAAQERQVVALRRALELATCAIGTGCPPAPRA